MFSPVINLVIFPATLSPFCQSGSHFSIHFSNQGISVCDGEARLTSQQSATTISISYNHNFMSVINDTLLASRDTTTPRCKCTRINKAVW